jgi:hypothetical protein
LAKFDISKNPSIVNEYDDGSGEEYSDGITALLNAFKSNAAITDLNVAGLVGEHSSAGSKVAALIVDAIKDMGAMLSKFTFSGDNGDSKPVTMETSMTEADFSVKGLGLSGATMLSAFLPKCT